MTNSFWNVWKEINKFLKWCIYLAFSVEQQQLENKHFQWNTDHEVFIWIKTEQLQLLFHLNLFYNNVHWIVHTVGQENQRFWYHHSKNFCVMEYTHSMCELHTEPVWTFKKHIGHTLHKFLCLFYKFSKFICFAYLLFKKGSFNSCMISVT
jgi:hypothetical protein